MAKRFGIIETKIINAKIQYEEDNDLLHLLHNISDIADYSIHAEWQRHYFNQALNKHFGEGNIKYKIKSFNEKDEETGEYLYWNNIDGWTDKESATIFSEDEKEKFIPPSWSCWEQIF
jgi:hypothetical protein